MACEYGQLIHRSSHHSLPRDSQRILGISLAGMAGMLQSAVDTVKAAVAKVDPRQPDWEVPSLIGKTAIVTGGNSGLGYESGLSMAKAGAHVILGCRSLEKGNEAAQQMKKAILECSGKGSVECLVIDVANLRYVKHFADEFLKRKQPLYILINNAGVFVPADETTPDGFEVLVGTNHFGPWYLTQLLVPALKEGSPSRIVWVSSPSETTTPDIDFDNLEGTGKQSDLAQYGLTKLFNLLSMREFHKQLVSFGIESFAAQPGIAQTGLFSKIQPEVSKPVGSAMRVTGPIVSQSATAGAEALTYAATSLNMTGKGGSVEHIVGPYYCGMPGLPSGLANIINVGNTGERTAQNPRAHDATLATKLYEKTGTILSQKVSAFDSSCSWA